MPLPIITVRDLRRLWKPQKERLSQIHAEHPTNIRFHRACSWLQRIEQNDGSDHDFALLGQWIALNALYGRWDETSCEPERDTHGWKTFLDRILHLDGNGHLATVLQEHKQLVLCILEDAYLTRFFWQEPGESRAKKAKKSRYEAHTWYLEQRWAIVLERVVERIYLLRCQLVHGAATYNGALNREATRRCATMLGHLLPGILLTWIDAGADEDWGTMCYPPQRERKFR